MIYLSKMLHVLFTLSYFAMETSFFWRLRPSQEACLLRVLNGWKIGGTTMGFEAHKLGHGKIYCTPYNYGEI